MVSAIMMTQLESRKDHLHLVCQIIYKTTWDASNLYRLIAPFCTCGGYTFAS